MAPLSLSFTSTGSGHCTCTLPSLPPEAFPTSIQEGEGRTEKTTLGYFSYE
jgi:hypothetical protein